MNVVQDRRLSSVLVVTKAFDGMGGLYISLSVNHVKVKSGSRIIVRMKTIPQSDPSARSEPSIYLSNV